MSARRIDAWSARGALRRRRPYPGRGRGGTRGRPWYRRNWSASSAGSARCGRPAPSTRSTSLATGPRGCRPPQNSGTMTRRPPAGVRCAGARAYRRHGREVVQQVPCAAGVRRERRRLPPRECLMGGGPSLPDGLTEAPVGRGRPSIGACWARRWPLSPGSSISSVPSRRMCRSDETPLAGGPGRPSLL
jgi:hypothetical protein